MSVAKRVARAERVNLRTVSDDIVRKNGRTKRAYAAAVFASADHDPHFRDAVLYLGADQMRRTYCTLGRHSSNSRLTENERKLRAQSRLIPRYWDQSTLYGGVILLGDATRPQLLESAAEYGKLERGNKNMRLFHEDVASRLRNDDAKVRDALSADWILQAAKKHHVVE